MASRDARRARRSSAFPALPPSPALLDRLAGARHRGVRRRPLGERLDGDAPERELHLVLARLDAAGGGIVLFHDTKAQTAAMLPAFLRALKASGYKVVHVVAAGPALAAR